MNAERLRELVDRLLEAERTFSLQSKVDNAVNPLQQLANNPADTNLQSQVVQALSTLEDALVSYGESITPAEREALISIGAGPYFTTDFVSEVREQLANNGLTPAVVAQSFGTKRDQRRTFLELLQSLSSNLEGVGITRQSTEVGTAELGILIPRDLFHNELDPLSKELHTINRILAIFSEATTGKTASVQVRQISTSDPTFFLGMDVTVVAAIAASITWLLNTLKQALEIKEVWSKAKTVGFSDEELKVFEEKAEKLIERHIEERVAELIPIDAKQGRQQELKNGLIWAHHSLLARIERGMTIDVRFLPPPDPHADDDGDFEEEAHEADQRVAFNQLAELAPQIEYPKPTGEALLKLPSADPPKQAGQRAKPNDPE